MFFKESRTGLNCQTNKRMTQKPEMNSGAFLGTLFIVIKNQPRVKRYVPKEGSFPIPLKEEACILDSHQVPN